jgi:hypothetical protein
MERKNFIKIHTSNEVGDHVHCNKLALVVLRDYRNGNDEWVEKMNEAIDDIQVAKFRKEIGI